MKSLILMALCALPAFGQTFWQYTASSGNVVLNAAATAVTLQQPAATCGPNANQVCSTTVTFPSSPPGGGGKPAGGAANSPGLWIYCSVACTATLISNGTAATATAGTVSPALGSGAPPANVQLFTASNASGGTTVLTLNVPAGGQTYDMSNVTLPAGGNGVNLTVSIASMTGTVNVTFYPLEAH